MGDCWGSNPLFYIYIYFLIYLASLILKIAFPLWAYINHKVCSDLDWIKLEMQVAKMHQYLASWVNIISYNNFIFSYKFKLVWWIKPIHRRWLLFVADFQPAGVQRVVFALLKIKLLSLQSVVPEQNRLKWGERLTVNLINL